MRGEGQFMHIPRREDKLETLAQQLKLLLWLLSPIAQQQCLNTHGGALEMHISP